MAETFEDGELDAIARFLSHFIALPGREATHAEMQALMQASAATQAFLQKLDQKVNNMSESLTAKLKQLQDDVAASKTVEEGAVALIQGFSGQLADLKKQLADAGVTPDQLALVDAVDAAVKSNASGLSAAVTANTSAAPANTPAPTDAQPASPAPTDTPATPAPANTGVSTSTEGAGVTPDQA